MGRNPLVRAHLDRIRIIKEKRNDPDLINCPQPVGFFWRVVDGQTQVVNAPCKRYDCPHCGPVRKNQILDKIYWGTLDIQMDTSQHHSYRMIRALTLTQHPDDPTDINEAFNRFRTSLRDKGIRNVRFFWVKEFTKQGTAHLHILVNRYIPQALLAAAWKNATYGWSYIVHITRVDMTLRKPAGYFAKYIGKALHDKNFRKGEHRYDHDRKTDWHCYSALPKGDTKWRYERFETWIPSMMARAGEEEAAADRGGGPSPEGGGSPLPAPPPGRSEQP